VFSSSPRRGDRVAPVAARQRLHSLDLTADAARRFLVARHLLAPRARWEAECARIDEMLELLERD
jgi:hypothetical protein